MRTELDERFALWVRNSRQTSTSLVKPAMATRRHGSGRRSEADLEDATAYEGADGDKNYFPQESDGAAMEVRLKDESFIATKITLGSGQSLERQYGRQNHQRSYQDQQRAPEGVTSRWRNPS
jgi:hypothetical protein